MILSYAYKLRPNTTQDGKMDNWLNMLRSHYNWCLADRIQNYYQQFIFGEFCDIRSQGVACPLTCCVVKGGAMGDPWTKAGKKRSAGAIQDAALPELKKARPWYAGIDSDVLQRNIARLNTAYENFFKHGRGFPKFRNRSNFRSFEYKPGRAKFKSSKVYLPGIGWMRFHNSRPIPNGLEIRSITIRQKADGWYMSVRIQDETIPAIPVMPMAEVKTAVGLDMGITKLIHCSDGSDVENPRPATNKKTKRILKIRQRRLSRARKGGKNRKKHAKYVAKLHKKITEKRNARQWKIANKIANKADCIFVEDLNIAGMIRRCKVKKDASGRFLPNGQSAKKELNRAIADCAWGDLTQKIEYTAGKLGKVFVRIDPKHTSQECSVCHHVDAASRDREKFICTNCGHIDHADKQAARNIKTRGVEAYSLTIKKVRRDSPKPLKEAVQLSLWETPSTESTVLKRRKSYARKSLRAVPGNLSVQLNLFSQDIWSEISVESPDF